MRKFSRYSFCCKIYTFSKQKYFFRMVFFFSQRQFTLPKVNSSCSCSIRLLFIFLYIISFHWSCVKFFLIIFNPIDSAYLQRSMLNLILLTLSLASEISDIGVLPFFILGFFSFLILLSSYSKTLAWIYIFKSWILSVGYAFVSYTFYYMTWRYWIICKHKNEIKWSKRNVNNTRIHSSSISLSISY